MDEDDITGLAQAFATAVARPGASAGLIGPSNELLGWVSIPDAVTSGRAFLVEPRDDILAVDLDSGHDRAWAAVVRTSLEPSGCRFVETNSGRPGHGHLWIVAPPGWGHDYLKAQMEDAAGANRAQVRTSGTRPPYSPHRSEPVRSTIVSPGVATALRWFRDAGPRPLSDVARSQLRWFPHEHSRMHRGTPSRDRTLYSVAVHMVNARLTFPDYLAELRSGSNETASKYREIDPRKRDDWAERKWKDAVEWVRANPPREVHRDTLEGLREATPDMLWAARTGANDRSVYAALVGLGLDAGSLVVNASVRQLSDLTTVSTSGVQAAVARLVEQGFIARVAEPNRAHHLARSYRLLASPPTRTTAPTHTWPYLGGPMTRCAEEAEILDDIFSNGSGLGLSTRTTWEALPTQPTKTAEVVALLGGQCKHNTIREHLKKLERHSLAGRAGHRWWRVQPDLEDLVRTALDLGVRGKSRRRRERHDRERREYLARFGPASTTPAA